MEYTKVSFSLQPKQPTADIITAELAAFEYESFIETEEGLAAFIPTQFFKEEQIIGLSLLNNPEFSIDYNIEIIQDQNWNAQWESNFEPIEVEDKCIIRAPFHAPDSRFQTEIIISPQMSFGTGHHETTWLMTKVAFDLNFENKIVLDMGCGTGILAILAKKMGAKKVDAIDIDSWAYENTIENAGLNNVDLQIEHGDADLIRNRSYDIIFANINRNILLQDIQKYAQSANPDCDLLLSGFFNTDIDTILEEARKNGFELVNKNIKNQWAMLHLTKK